MRTKSRTARGKLRSGPSSRLLVPATAPLSWWLRVSPLWIVLAVLAVYVRVLGFDFVGLDDTDILSDRYYLIGHLSNLKLAFTTDAFLGTSGNFYRPLQTVSFMVDALFGGPKPFLYHLTNLFLHITASLCMLWLLLKLGYPHALSLLLALLFAAHPMFALMLGWVPARGDLLLTIFIILSFLLFLSSFRTNHPRLLLLGHATAFFLAFLSKETAVALPALCLIFYCFELRKSSRRALIYQYLAVWCLIGGAWYYLHSLLHPDRSQVVVGLTACGNNLRVVPELLGKFFVPIKFQLVPLFNWTDTSVGLATGLLLALFLIRTGHLWNKRVHLGCLWFLLFMLPGMMFRNKDAQYMFEYLYHRAYLPAVGLLIVSAEFLTKVVVSNSKAPRRVVFVSLPLLAYCGLGAFHEVGFYHDPVRFFSEAIVRTPQNALCYNNRGAYYANVRNDQRSALGDFNRAIEIFPAFVAAILNRGLTCQKLGNEEQSVADFEAALRLFHPDDPDTIFRLANLRYLRNDFANAAADYNRILAIDKLYPRIFSKRADCEAMLGQAQEALRDAELALRADPRDEEAYNNRGFAKRLMGKLDEAKSDYDQAIRIKSDYSRPFNNRATIYLDLGDRQKALQDLDRAIQLDPLFAEAYNNRGCVEHQLGQHQTALKDLNSALRLSPKFADAYQNRGSIRNVLGLFPGALADFNQAINLKPRNREAYVGRGIAKLSLGDGAGSCEDWKQALSLGSEEAPSLLAEHCK